MEYQQIFLRNIVALLLVSPVSVLPLRQNDIQHLTCSSPCFKNESKLFLSNSKYLTCAIKYTDIYPPIEKKNAPAPRNLFATWFYYKETIALKILWQQKKNHIINNFVRGYFLRISAVTIDSLNEAWTNYNIALDYADSTWNISRGVHKPWVEFLFTCNEKSYDYNPGNCVSVNLYSLPARTAQGSQYCLWIPSDKEDLTSRSINIATCKQKCGGLMLDKDALEMSTSRSFENLQTTKQVTFPVTEKENVHATVLSANKSGGKSTKRLLAYYTIPIASMLSIFLFVVILRIMRLKSCKIAGHQSIRTGNILMIANVQCQHDLDFCHKLTCRLRKDFSLNILCNWENTTQITQSRTEWYNDMVHHADVTVLVNARELFHDQDQEKKKLLEICDLRRGVHIAKNHALIHKKQIILLYTEKSEVPLLKKSEKKCFLVCTSTTKISKLMHYLIKNNMTLHDNRSILEYINGKQRTSKSKNNYSSRESISIAESVV